MLLIRAPATTAIVATAQGSAALSLPESVNDKNRPGIGHRRTVP